MSKTIGETWTIGEALISGRWVTAFICPDDTRVHVVDGARQAKLLRQFPGLTVADFPLGCYREIYAKDAAACGFSLRHTSTLRVRRKIMTEADPVAVVKPPHRRPPRRPAPPTPPRRMPPRRKG